jgi:bifunctional non-homologous end joining protein LigD
VAARKALGEYRRKRDFRRTPEPPGRGDRGRDGFFMVHKHAARRLHYDLRLAIDGVLKSWAVPRGPSLDPTQKRLAVHVEDHPLAYADFEGTIPEGNYGAGTVIVWDRGAFGVTGEGTPSEQLADGRLHLVLAGEKLRGAFMLVKTRGRGPDAGRSWLLMKKRDAFATTADVTKTAPASVQSGLTIEALRGDAPDTGDRPRLAAPLDADALMHPTLVDAIPPGSGWLFEIKWDGVRVLATRTGGRVRLHMRSGIDVTARYPEVATAFARVAGGDLAMDGEIVALDGAGRPSFALLAERMHRTPRPGAPAVPPVSCYVFDCLACDGRDVRGLPLVARKALCRARLPAGGPLRYCDHVDHDGEAFLRAACAARLEGVVAKRAASVYRAGRSREWLKVKCTKEETFVVGGWTDPAGTRGHLGALHVGERRDGVLAYAGKVGSGFDEKSLAVLAAALAPLARDVSPFATGDPPRGRTHHWVEPRLRCRVRYVERTPDGRLRHPVFMGLEAGDAPTPRRRSATPRRRARRR